MEQRLIKQILSLSKKLGNQKVYLAPNYYRIKCEEDIYRISRLMADPCGGYLHNPRLTVRIDLEKQQLTLLNYYKDYETAVKLIYYTPLEKDFFMDELIKILKEMTTNETNN